MAERKLTEITDYKVKRNGKYGVHTQRNQKAPQKARYISRGLEYFDYGKYN